MLLQIRTRFRHRPWSGQKKVRMLPNPAIEEFRSRVNAGTSPKDALIIARNELVKNMVQRGRLHERWLKTTRYLCLIALLWEGLSLFTLYNEFIEKKGLSNADLTLALQHAISSLLAVVLVFADMVIPHTPQFKFLHLFKRLLTTSLVAAEVAYDVNTYRNGLRSAMNQKVLHYPFMTIVYVLQHIQLRYMKNEKERNEKIFLEIDGKVKAFVGEEEKVKQEKGGKAEGARKRKSAKKK